MKPVLLAGTIIVNFALLSYSIAIITEQRKKIVSNIVLAFLTVGVVFDIAATTCMIIGSESGPFTVHGILGYSSLTGMLIDCILIWRFRLRNGPAVNVARGLHLYSRLAYFWWILAYITGAVLIAVR
ncbi:MAG: hypothetical protein JSV52_10095 [Candidatus Zixiibacteriota bacterium]|nr:MAG: hypothetical protein JSV52_10095 [candidate division Zixibacteria bacterium]